MIGLDTNVLLRFIVQDDSKQAAQATKLIFSQEIFFISSISLTEIIWTLTRSYKWNRRQISSLLETLLEATNLVFEDEASVAHATWAYRSDGDWSDHFIHAQCKKHHCTSLATFDRKFAECYPDFINLLS